MKKDDLKSGDIVGLRNNSKGIVLLGASELGETQDIIIDLDSAGVYDLTSYRDDLKHESTANYDIMRVCGYPSVSDNLIEHNLISFISHAPDWEKWTWYRKEKMTLAEIEKELRLRG